ncbi:MAG: prepilin peptidase [Bryobacteraceae bacterium]|nr:prepilin peptidase [Bryobacteraceae bacterium]
MIEILIAGLFGLLTGSFLNVCIYRLPRDESVVHPRSHCPNCGKFIAWYDNLPVLSWLLLQARCRHCKTPISARYPAVELATGILFAAVVTVHGFNITALKYCVFMAILIDLIITDWEERILPDEFTLGGTLAGLVFAWFVAPPAALLSLLLPESLPAPAGNLIDAAVAAAFLAFTLWSVGAIYAKVRGKEGLGFGDVKMVACIGAFLGLSPSLLALTIGSVAGSLGGVIWIFIARKDPGSYQLPFGTFLGLGALIVTLLPQLG